MTTDVREIAVCGDFAYLRNYITLAVTRPEGRTVHRAGYTLTVLRKVQGRWLLSRDANLVTTSS